MSIEKCMSTDRTPAECYVNKTEHKQKINALSKTLHTLYNLIGSVQIKYGRTSVLSLLNL